MGKMVKFVNDEDRSLKTVERYIIDSLEPAPYSYTGQLEFLREHVEKVSKAFGRLISILIDDTTLSEEDLNTIISPLYGDKVGLVDENKYNE